MRPDRPPPDAREVDRVEGVVTVPDEAAADAFLARCVPGASWSLRIRTAEVAATVLARVPLGTFDERICTCVRLLLTRPVPVEPGLRFRLIHPADPPIEAVGVVRPWTS
jgi:hypothetical protein